MSTAHDPLQAVEAARYALLRRMAYAMRHHMVVHLQPIGMIMEVMERRLAAPSPDLGQVHEAMGKVNLHARAAVQSSLDVVSWLSPEEGQLIGAGAGAAECHDLLRSHLNFRGFTLRNEVSALPREVSRSAMRGVLPAALLAMTDHAQSPADVVMSAREDEREVQLAVLLRPATGSPGFAGEAHYRLLQWADVEAIAQAEGVTLQRAGNVVTLSFPA